MNKLFNGIVACLAAFGVFAILGGGYFLSKSVSAKSWPTTQGTIISSKIVETIEDGKKVYRPKVRYEYFVDSVRYESNKVALSGMKTKRYSMRVVGSYPSGEEVAVFYNARNPSEALLEVGASPILYGFLALGLIFIFISSVLMLFRTKFLLCFEGVSSTMTRRQEIQKKGA